MMMELWPANVAKGEEGARCGERSNPTTPRLAAMNLAIQRYGVRSRQETSGDFE
jgi:hypothetical protein